MRTGPGAAAIGVVIGLAWATSLRAWMSHLAIEFGDWPVYTWEGTFLSILLPAAVIGALIGFDWQRNRASKSRVPGVIWSPLLLIVGPAVVADDFIGTLFDSGEGGGAISVVLIGLCGALAIAGRGPHWVRALAGFVAVGVTAAMVLFLYVRGGAATASRAFGGVHLMVLLAWLAVCCSLPLRQHTSAGADTAMDGRSAPRIARRRRREAVR